jgi:hypothetical protein
MINAVLSDSVNNVEITSSPHIQLIFLNELKAFLKMSSTSVSVGDPGYYQQEALQLGTDLLKTLEIRKTVPLLVRALVLAKRSD